MSIRDCPFPFVILHSIIESWNATQVVPTQVAICESLASGSSREPRPSLKDLQPALARLARSELVKTARRFFLVTTRTPNCAILAGRPRLRNVAPPSTQPVKMEKYTLVKAALSIRLAVKTMRAASTAGNRHMNLQELSIYKNCKFTRVC